VRTTEYKTTEYTEFKRERKRRRCGRMWCKSSALYFLIFNPILNSEFNSVLLRGEFLKINENTLT